MQVILRDTLLECGTQLIPICSIHGTQPAIKGYSLPPQLLLPSPLDGTWKKVVYTIGIFKVLTALF